MRLPHPRLVVAILIGVLVIAVQAAAALTDTDQDSATGITDGVPFHPFTIDAPTGGCPRWTEPDGTTTRNCDPINLIFPGTTWQEVQDALLARDWVVYGIATSQTLNFGDAAAYPQDAHVFWPDGHGLQYHVRLWQVRGVPSPVTIAAVHYERTVNFRHVIDLAWDEAESFVARQFCRGRRVSCSTTTVLAEQATIQARDFDGDGNPATWRGWANDTRATVIRLWP